MYRVGEEEIEALRKVVESKLLFRLGDPAKGHCQAVATFEREWAAKIDIPYSLFLSGGGTAALICALAALEIGPGDEVLVPAYTWMATAAAVLAVGAIPVVCDVDETLAIDPEDVNRKIGPNVRAVIPVHMAGRVANLERLLEICRSNGLFLIEDACQCDGGSYHGQRVGTWGDFGCYSFNDFKILSCGEGGALVTRRRDWFDRARIHHDYLTSFPTFGEAFTVPVYVGGQYRASELMGAMMLAQLDRLDGILMDLRKNGKALLEKVTNLRQAPNNDPEGDCHVVVAFQFSSEHDARRFATAEGVNGWLPVDTGRHVYQNWDPLLTGRIGHCADMNPLNHPKNAKLRRHYRPDDCLKTLDILSRTVYISIDPDWAEDEVEKIARACRQATTPTFV